MEMEMARVIKSEKRENFALAMSKGAVVPRIAKSGARIIHRSLYLAQIEAARIRADGEVKKKEIGDLSTTRIVEAGREEFAKALLDANADAAKELLGAFLEHVQTITAQTEALCLLTKEIAQKICGPDLDFLDEAIEAAVNEELKVLRGKRRVALAFPLVDRSLLESEEPNLFDVLAKNSEFDLIWDANIDVGHFIVSCEPGSLTLHQRLILPFLREKLNFAM
jgi:hypothetical protein